MSSRVKKALNLVLVNASLFAVLLLLTEGLARWLCAGELEALFPDPFGDQERPLFVEHANRGYALRPGHRGVETRVNEHGFRGPGLPQNSWTILAFGDSTSFGHGVPDDQTYPAHLERILRPQYPDLPGDGLRTIKAGVPGYTSEQVRLYLEEVLADDSPVHPNLITLSVSWNDIWMSTVINWRRDMLIFRRPRGLHGWLKKHCGTYRCMLLHRAMQSELLDVWNQPAFDAYGDNVEAMILRAQEEDVPIVLFETTFAASLMTVLGLSRAHISYSRDYFIEVAMRYQEAAAEIAARHGVSMVKHRVALGRPDRGEETFVDPIHPNALGNQMLAEDMAAFLVGNGLLPAE